MDYNLSNTVVGDTRPTTLDYEAPATDTDGVSAQKETFYDNEDWRDNFGLFNDDPHSANVCINRGQWIWGRGWEADQLTEQRMELWNGWGKDTALDILQNMEVTCAIQGDSHAEIIWNDSEKRDFPINIKPLNPGTMRHVVNGKGVLVRFEQLARLGDKVEVVRKFNPEDILHFVNDRIADQIHGTSILKRLRKYILAQGESFEDNKLVMHREAKPVILIKLKTSDTTKIGEIKSRVQEAQRMSTDNIMFIPDDQDVFSYEVLKINTPSPILMEWKDSVRKDLYSTGGSPELLSDSSGSTESGGKIGNLNFAQIVEKRQLEREQQIKRQLHLQINLMPPKSIEETLMTDAMKDGAGQQLNFQPQDAQGGRDNANQEQAQA